MEQLTNQFCKFFLHQHIQSDTDRMYWTFTSYCWTHLECLPSWFVFQNCNTIALSEHCSHLQQAVVPFQIEYHFNTAGGLLFCTCTIELWTCAVFWSCAVFQMVTLLGTDGQKLYEAVLYGSYIITAPVVFLFCIASCIYILSSNNFHTLITLPIFLVIYPLLVSFESFNSLNHLFIVSLFHN